MKQKTRDERVAAAIGSGVATSVGMISLDALETANVGLLPALVAAGLVSALAGGVAAHWVDRFRKRRARYPQRTSLPSN